MKSKNPPSKQQKKPAAKKSFSDQVHELKLLEAKQIQERRAKVQKEKYDEIEESLLLQMFGPIRHASGE